jgi:uncharacterized membrane protein
VYRRGGPAARHHPFGVPGSEGFLPPRLDTIRYNTRSIEPPDMMVREIEDSARPEISRIEVLSNLSLTLDRLAGFFLLISGVTLGVALLPTVMGYWPIMAIAVVHLAIVGWCFRLAWRGHWARQDIEIDEEQVRIGTCTARGCQQQVWPSGWVRIERVDLGSELRVFLALHQRQIEIGRFLPEFERQQAAELIAGALARRCARAGIGRVDGISKTVSQE